MSSEYERFYFPELQITYESGWVVSALGELAIENILGTLELKVDFKSDLKLTDIKDRQFVEITDRINDMIERTKAEQRNTRYQEVTGKYNADSM